MRLQTAQRRISNILLPLISPTLINAFFWIALADAERTDIGDDFIQPDNITLSVVIWSLWSSGQHGPSAAMSLVMILLMLPVMIGYWSIGNRAADMLTGIRR